MGVPIKRTWRETVRWYADLLRAAIGEPHRSDEQVRELARQLWSHAGLGSRQDFFNQLELLQVAIECVSLSDRERSDCHRALWRLGRAAGLDTATLRETFRFVIEESSET